ncbi:glycosyltransferase family 2 protein [Algoriphagus sp.]|uniref:glycosyltransferase family 2 protein n=1 Tax=Algoriphagus sp. TaxID=1872435 RepID=UPI003F725BCA
MTFINYLESEIQVSVIIPIYNAEYFIERAVYSSINQDFVKEVILVDDNSTDNSLKICFDLEKRLEKIVVLSSCEGKNKGASDARNRGLEKASGNWIQFLDADDELLLGKILNQVSIISNSKKIVPFVVGNSVDVFPGGRKHLNRAFGDPWQGLICSKLGNSCANLFNFQFLKAVNFFDVKMKTSEEYDLMFRVMKLGYLPLFDRNFSTLIHKTQNSLSRDHKNFDLIVENWIGLRLKIRNYLELTDKFSVKYDFYYSVYMGMFHVDYRINFHPSINRIYFLSFKGLLWGKSKLKDYISRHEKISTY